ncbi:hypothetical protein QVD17_33807 [Tagetes erecta]|uniref:Pectinesterase inhibitor domain-containing protein n=1 Tax=Tagetes erecta TaxID=13708 RepID=A0AAD8NKU6_TARER|nr:hypothetical protein QVD17_33807 [Tagetes erecta]
MTKEKFNMELTARILLIISISSLILYLSVEGLNILPSITQTNSRLDAINHSEKDQGSPVSNEAKDAFIGSPVLAPTPSPTSLWGGITKVIGEAQKTIAPVTSSIVNEAESISSSIFDKHTKVSSPVPAPVLGSEPYPDPPSSLSPGPTPSSFLGPNLPSSPDLGPTPSPFQGHVPYPSQPSSSPGSGLPLAPSPFSGPAPYPDPPSFSPRLAPGPSPSPSGFIDHDVALAIETRIKRSQSDAQLAMDTAKKLLKDPNIASSETGMCLSKCVDKYGASLKELNRAITDLGVRDVTLLADDFGAVEIDISACQACFTENIGEDSPLKALEEATMKAARECLTVMDYAA